MARLIFKNNAQSSLAVGIGPTANVLVVQGATGVLFAQPNPGEYWVGTLIDAATGLRNEIVHVTQVSGDSMTIVRAQEGTSAQTWEAGDSFSELWTAGQCQAMLQQGDEQSGSSTFGLDTGIANAYSVVLNPPLTANTMGQTLRFKAANSNTGASTLNFGTGAAPLLNAQGQPLSGGEIIANYVYEAYWNGAGYNMAMPSLVRIPTGMITPFAGGAVPTGWLACIGGLLAIASQPALFAVLGTIYGGDGITTFGIPDLRGRTVAGLDGGQNRLTAAGMIDSNGNVVGGTGGRQTESASIAGNPVTTSGSSTVGSLSVDTLSYAMDGENNDGNANSGPGGSFSFPQVGHIHANVRAAGSATGTLTVLGQSGSLNAGSATATVTNVQPTMTMNYMIKT